MCTEADWTPEWLKPAQSSEHYITVRARAPPEGTVAHGAREGLTFVLFMTRRWQLGRQDALFPQYSYRWESGNRSAARFIRKPASLPCLCNWDLVFRLPFPLGLETETLQSHGSWLHQGFSQQPAETHGDVTPRKTTEPSFPWVNSCSGKIGLFFTDLVLSKLTAVP